MAARYAAALLVLYMVATTDLRQMPLVGFGLWKVNNDTCADTVYNAIKSGYRLFDGACGTSNKSPNSIKATDNVQTTAMRSRPAKE